MSLTDTHCHIHEAGYGDPEGALARARQAGVERLICVGTSSQSSREAVEFTASRDGLWASVGLHPHDAVAEGNLGIENLRAHLLSAKNSNIDKIVAIGECGLDYFYEHSPRDVQIPLLEAQLQLAVEYEKPVIFHVRDASPTESRRSVWSEFWPIFDNFPGLSGVMHSFTDSQANLEQGLARGLYVGVNGISTFTKDVTQQAMFGSIPLEKLLFETDAPFLTPVPLRGRVNEPAFITHVAHSMANLRSINLEELSRTTERNATTLFFSN